MSKLSLPDLLTLQALRRAGRDVLTWRAGQFFDDGHLVGVLRSDVLAALVEDGLLELSTPDGDGVARVGVSEAGRAVRGELGRAQRRSELAVPPEQHPVAESPAEKGAGRGTAGR